MAHDTTEADSGAGWSRILMVVGSLAVLIGAVDPMEGSVVILAGSSQVALGAFLGHGEWRFIAYRVAVFVLMGIGVGSMWAFDFC